MPTSYIRHHPWGQEEQWQGPVKISSGSLYMKSKLILELSKVMELPRRSNSVAVRLDLAESDWLQVEFDTSKQAEAFHCKVAGCIKKMNAKTSKVDKENAIVKHPLNSVQATANTEAAVAVAEEAGVRHTQLPRKRSAMSTPSNESAASKLSRQETPEKIANTRQPDELEEDFRDMVRSWMNSETHDSEQKASASRMTMSTVSSSDVSRSLELADDQEHADDANMSQAAPAQAEAESLRSDDWVLEHWDFGALLASNASTLCEVRVAVHRQSEQQRVLKIIKKSVNQRSAIQCRSSHVSLRSEAELLMNLEHPHIIKLHDVFETDMHIYLVMEYAPAGDLFSLIFRHGHMKEVDARRLFLELCNAVRYLHDKGVVHRDLKLQNILLTERDPSCAHVKVADLGVSRKAERSCDCRTFCGTLDYLAPEVVALRTPSRSSVTSLHRVTSRRASHPPSPSSAEKTEEGGYGRPADMWSLGVTLYMMLCGQPPFDGHQGDDLLVKQIKDGEWLFDVRPWKSVSAEAKDLIVKLLEKEPRKRLTIGEVFEHSWLRSAE